MKSILIALGLCVTFFTETLAQKDPKALQILDAMSAHYKKTPAFKASFKYMMENPDEDINEGFTGKIAVKGDKYKLFMEGQEIIFDGVNVYTYLKEENELTIAPYNTKEEEISISNIFSIYKTGFKYLYLESKEGGKIDVIDLVPENLEKTYYKIRMEIKSNTKDLQNFKIFDKSGNRYLYEIVTFAEDTGLTDKDFTFDIKGHSGIDVVDFR